MTATEYYYNTPATINDVITLYNLSETEIKDIKLKAGDELDTRLFIKDLSKQTDGEPDTDTNNNNSKLVTIDKEELKRMFERQASSLMSQISQITPEDPKELKMLVDAHTTLYSTYFKTSDTNINFNQLQNIFNSPEEVDVIEDI